MQKCPIYLYPNLFEVILDLDQNTRIHNIMYQRNIQLQKGLKNRVQIQFKNSDQKLLPVSTSSFVFSMFDAINQRQVVRKVVSMIDDGVTTSTKGLGVLELAESDTLDLDVGTYKFTVANVESDGSYLPTYANTYYGIGGTIELRQDSYPVLQPSMEEYSFQDQYNYDTQLHDYYSGPMYAAPQFNGNSALHTMAIYMTKFKGTVHIQATQSNTPGYFDDYATIQTLTYTGRSGIDYINFNGVFSYVRIKYTPTPDPVSGNNNHMSDTYHGTIDRVLYRS